MTRRADRPERPSAASFLGASGSGRHTFVAEPGWSVRTVPTAAVAGGLIGALALGSLATGLGYHLDPGAPAEATVAASPSPDESAAAAPLSPRAFREADEETAPPPGPTAAARIAELEGRVAAAADRLVARGEAALEADAPARARAAFREALALDPRRAAAADGLARAEAAAHRRSEDAAARRAGVEAALARARKALAADDIEAADAALEAAIARGASAATAAGLAGEVADRARARGLAAAIEAAAAERAAEARARLEEARARLEAGELTAAAAAFGAAADLDPERAEEAEAGLEAVAAAAARRLARAERDARSTAREEAREEADAAVAAARARFRRGDVGEDVLAGYRRAIEALERAAGLAAAADDAAAAADLDAEARGWAAELAAALRYRDRDDLAQAAIRWWGVPPRAVATAELPHDRYLVEEEAVRTGLRRALAAGLRCEPSGALAELRQKVRFHHDYRLRVEVLSEVERAGSSPEVALSGFRLRLEDRVTGRTFPSELVALDDPRPRPLRRDAVGYVLSPWTEARGLDRSAALDRLDEAARRLLARVVGR